MTGNRLTRLHEFGPISTLRLPLCSCCGKRFAIGRPALRCKVCRLVVHDSCQHQVSLFFDFVSTSIFVTFCLFVYQLKQRCVPPTDYSPPSPPEPTDPPRTPLSATLSRRYFASSNNLSPGLGTPTTAGKHRFVWHSIPLASLCPSNEFPQVPAPVIHCVNEVASRGLLQVGIYRVPGAEKKVFGE